MCVPETGSPRRGERHPNLSQAAPCVDSGTGCLILAVPFGRKEDSFLVGPIPGEDSLAGILISTA